MAQKPKKKTRKGPAPKSKRRVADQVSSQGASVLSGTSSEDAPAAASSAASAAPRRRRSSRPRRPGELSRFQKGVIIVFIVVFALSTLAGAFASMVQGEQQQSSQSTTEKPTVASMDERYQPLVTELEGKVSDNAEDKASLLSLGRYCFQWGASVRSLGTTDADTSHANELFEKAIAAYDQYLALEDSSAVRVDRALCQFYEGKTSEAQSALEELTEKDPEYGPAWANLGMLLEATGKTDDARAAYQKAIETDPDDEYQAKTYAEQRLKALDQAAEQAQQGDASASDSQDSDSTAGQGQDLAGDLASGTGL